MDLKERYLTLLKSIKEILKNENQMHISSIKKKMDIILEDCINLENEISKEKEWEVGGSGLTEEDKQEINNSLLELKSKIDENSSQIDEKANKNEVGSPLIANTVAEMIDKTKVYVYLGNEEEYIKGNWYVWNGTIWESGGVYNSIAIGEKSIKAKHISDEIDDNNSVGIETDTCCRSYDTTTYLPNESNSVTYGFFLIKVPVQGAEKLKVYLNKDSTNSSIGLICLRSDGTMARLNDDTNSAIMTLEQLQSKYTSKIVAKAITYTDDNYYILDISILKEKYEDVGSVWVQFENTDKSNAYVKDLTLSTGKIRINWLSYGDEIDETNANIASMKSDIEELKNSEDSYNIQFCNCLDEYYAIVGHEINLYFDNFISCDRQNDIRYEVVCSTLPSENIKYFTEGIRINPVQSNIGTHNITINVYSIEWKLLSTKTISLNILEDIILSTPKKVLFLGDSLTQAGVFIAELKRMFGDNFILYGTRERTQLDSTGKNQNILHEGRASWSAYNYCHTSSKNGMTNPFLNNNNFDFSYYIANEGKDFADVEYIFIYLGTNDGYNTNGMTALKQIVNSIHSYNSNIKILINTCHMLPDNNDGCGINKQNVWQKRKQIRNWNNTLVANFSTTDNVIIIPSHINLDTEYDYPSREEARNSRNPAIVNRIYENVHPSSYGYYHIADVDYAYFVNLIKK